ncbi:MAG: ATP synthase F1 subunit gamma [Bryobacterales bacterium]|nr:ATP synthase F1 subunit gamma [Bryobacterales bacterium]
MPSLIDIRRRIRSVRNTQQITKAMKMVSAAKLRRAQDRVIAARPYAGVLGHALSDLIGAAAGEERLASNPLLARRPEQRILLLLLTGDRGLAGAFNSNLIKASQSFVEERAGAEIAWVLIGRKGRDFYRKQAVRIVGEHIGLAARVEYRDAAAIASDAIQRFRDQEVDAVYLVNNEFKSVISQKLTVTRLLPIELPEGKPLDYIYEQPPVEILEKMLPRYVETEVYRAMLESAAAEHAARMTAMDAATSNAAEIIESLTLYLNRVRQASITKEIIEVVSGAAAGE